MANATRKLNNTNAKQPICLRSRCRYQCYLDARARNCQLFPMSEPYRAGKSLQFWVANMFAAPVRRSGKERVPLMTTGVTNRRDAPNSTSQYSL
jgi:hypothetical protein